MEAPEAGDAPAPAAIPSDKARLVDVRQANGRVPWRIVWSLGEDYQLQALVPGQPHESVSIGRGWGQRDHRNSDRGATLPYVLRQRRESSGSDSFVSVFEGAPRIVDWSNPLSSCRLHIRACGLCRSGDPHARGHGCRRQRGDASAGDGVRARSVSWPRTAAWLPCLPNRVSPGPGVWLRVRSWNRWPAPGKRDSRVVWENPRCRPPRRVLLLRLGRTAPELSMLTGQTIFAIQGKQRRATRLWRRRSEGRRRVFTKLQDAAARRGQRIGTNCR